MKFLGCLLLVFGGMAVASGATNHFQTLDGTFAGTATVTTSGLPAQGPITVTITASQKKARKATVQIDGSVTSHGNVVPLRTKLRLRGRQVRAESFLLGLQGVRVSTQTAKLKNLGDSLRFRLAASPEAVIDGGPVSGTITYLIRLKDGQLLITGKGAVTSGEGRTVPVSIFISATRIR